MRRVLRRRGITPRIARPGIDSSQHLGRHRWVVERTFAWLVRYRRLVVDYEYHPETSEASIQAAMIHRMLRKLHPQP